MPMRRARFNRNRRGRQFNFKRRVNWRQDETNKKRLFLTRDLIPTVNTVSTTNIEVRASQFTTFASASAPYKKYRMKNARVQITTQQGFRDTTFTFNSEQGWITSWKDPLNQDTGTVTLETAGNKQGAKNHRLNGFSRKVVPTTTSDDLVGTMANTITNFSPWLPVGANTPIYHILKVTFPDMNDGTGAGDQPVPYDLRIWVDFQFSGRAL